MMRCAQQVSGRELFFIGILALLLGIGEDLCKKSELTSKFWNYCYTLVYGIADHIHVIVVASKGFEEWEQTERERDLYNFLRKKLGDKNIVKIFLLLTLTEEENEKYMRVHVD